MKPRRLIEGYVSEVIHALISGGRRLEAPGNDRLGTAIRTSPSPNDENDGPKAAVVLVRRADGKVLAVSRKDDPNAFGLPGGTVEPGERVEDAAVRELKEETGLTLLEPIEAFSSLDATGYHTTTFLGKVSGSVSTSEKGVVAWVDPQQLIDGPFGEFNKRLFATLGIG